MKKSTLNHPSVLRLAKILPRPSRTAILQNLSDYRGSIRQSARSIPVAPVRAITHARDYLDDTDRSARRAANDKKYAAQVKRSLTARVRTLNKPPRACSTASVGKWLDARAALARELVMYDGAAGIKPAVTLKSENTVVALPSVGERDAEHAKITVVKRGANWSIEPTLAESHFYHEDGETEWKNGRPISYARAINTTYVQSAAWPSGNGKNCYFLYCGARYLRQAPDGHKFLIDENGLKLCRAADHDADYHLNAQDIYHFHAAKIVDAINANAKKRAEQRAHVAAMKAEAEGVYICLNDSLRAGNCEGGTIAWAKRHNIDIKKHHPAAALVKYAVENRVALAIYASIKRHRVEMARGYADLADHH